MIRKCTDEDISDEELEKVINPFYDNYHEYVITYVVPEVIAFYIASSYSRNAMWEATFISIIIQLRIYLMLVIRYTKIGGNTKYIFTYV